MSEQDVSAALDETPEADVVDPVRPRSQSAYKLCMECGQNVLRYNFRAGSSVCKPCEAQATPAGGEAPVAAEDGPVMLPPQETMSGSTAALAADEREVALVGGSRAARSYLSQVCGVREGEALTLEVVAAHVRQMREAEAQMIGRVTRYGVARGPVRPEEVPLEVAAEALLLACDPLVQERLRAAMEMLQQPLNRVILGNLAYHDQDLLDQDPALVPEAPYAVQFGPQGGRRPATPGRSGVLGGRLVDAQGQLVKDCLCCGREFHPPHNRPNPDFCDDGCGTFVDQLRIWATNTVLNRLRYHDTDVAPQPDPRLYWPPERCQEPMLSHALAFREVRAAQQMGLAEAQQAKMRGA